MSGLSDKEIAQKMTLSTDTVRTYWKRIRKKVGGANRAEIIALMARQGLQKELEAKQSQYDDLIAEISRRRAVEETLRLYRIAFDRACNGQMILAGNDHQIRNANSKVGAMFGCNEVELLGQSWIDFLDAEAEALVAAEFGALDSSGESKFRCKHKRKDGSLFEAQVCAYSEQPDDGTQGYRIVNLTEVQ